MSSSSSHRTSVLDVADELSSLDIIDVDEEAEPTPAACASERAPVIDVDDLDAAAGTANASEIGTPSQPSMVENSAIDEYDEDLGSNNGDPDGVASTEPFDGLAGAALAESLLPLELSDGSRALLLVLSRGQRLYFEGAVSARVLEWTIESHDADADDATAAATSINGHKAPLRVAEAAAVQVAGAVLSPAAPPSTTDLCSPLSHSALAFEFPSAAAGCWLPQEQQKGRPDHLLQQQHQQQQEEEGHEQASCTEDAAATSAAPAARGAGKRKRPSTEAAALDAAARSKRRCGAVPTASRYSACVHQAEDPAVRQRAEQVLLHHASAASASASSWPVALVLLLPHSPTAVLRAAGRWFEQRKSTAGTDTESMVAASWLPLFRPVTETKALLRFPAEWQQCVGQVAAMRGPQAPVVAVLGLGGTGKSTFCRALVNQLLLAHEVVAFLDCDVGQPELTPPGLLSLHLLTEPLFGPSYTHLRQPARAIFFGDATPADEPQLYLESISFLCAAADSIDAAIPMVINTNGWVSNLGFELLSSIIRFSEPTHIVHLCLNRADGLGLAEVADVRSSAPSAQQYYLPASPNLLPRIPVLKQDIRNVQLAAYFYASSVDPHGTSLTAMRPYRISWHHLRLRIASAQYGEGAPVSEREAATLPAFLSATPICECKGLGLVRGVDMEAKQLLIVSPLSPRDIKHVNTLLKGTIELEASNFDASGSVGEAPFFVAGSVSNELGGTTMRSRRNLLRSRTAGPGTSFLAEM